MTHFKKFEHRTDLIKIQDKRLLIMEIIFNKNSTLEKLSTIKTLEFFTEFQQNTHKVSIIGPLKKIRLEHRQSEILINWCSKVSIIDTLKSLNVLLIEIFLMKIWHWKSVYNQHLNFFKIFWKIRQSRKCQQMNLKFRTYKDLTEILY